jgi:hypothetical protein
MGPHLAGPAAEGRQQLCKGSRAGAALLGKG